jgi:hypothetical protein
VIAAFGSSDVIDLSAVDARPVVPGGQDFVSRGSSAFTGAGQLRYWVSGADKIIQGNLDAHSAPDIEVLLLGYADTPNGGDFLL